MGRPRKNLSSRFRRVVTDVDASTKERLEAACRAERTSERKLLRSLIQSWLDEPVCRLTYKDPVLFENGNPAEYSTATFECIGWQDPSVKQDEVGIVWLRRCGERLPGEKQPPGSRGIVLPKGCVVELRRTTSL